MDVPPDTTVIQPESYTGPIDLKNYDLPIAQWSLPVCNI